MVQYVTLSELSVGILPQYLNMMQYTILAESLIGTAQIIELLAAHCTVVKLCWVFSATICLILFFIRMHATIHCNTFWFVCSDVHQEILLFYIHID
jgi:hypothetical protein